MVDLGLYNFIKNAFARGQTEAQVREALAKAGWGELLIAEGIAAVKEGKEPNISHLQEGVSEYTEDVASTDARRAGRGLVRCAFSMFTGRIGVGGYWKAVLVGTLFSIALWVGLFFALSALAKEFAGTGLGGAVVTLLSALVLAVFARSMIIFFSLGVLVRRLHDLGLSGWMSLLFILVPMAGAAGTVYESNTAIYTGSVIAVVAFWLLVAFWPGRAEANRYGPFTCYSWLDTYFGNGGLGSAFFAGAIVSIAMTVLYALFGATLVAAALGFASSLMSPNAATTTPQAFVGTAAEKQMQLQGRDAAVQADLSMIQRFALVYYEDHNGTYGVAGVCGAPKSLFSNPTIANAVHSIQGNGATPSCAADGSAYAVVAPAQTAAGHYFCVDSAGALKEETGTATPMTACP